MQMVQKLHSAALKIIQVFILFESIHESLKYESISHSVSTHPSRCKSWNSVSVDGGWEAIFIVQFKGARFFSFYTNELIYFCHYA